MDTCVWLFIVDIEIDVPLLHCYMCILSLCSHILWVTKWIIHVQLIGVGHSQLQPFLFSCKLHLPSFTLARFCCSHSYLWTYMNKPCLHLEMGPRTSLSNECKQAISGQEQSYFRPSPKAEPGSCLAKCSERKCTNSANSDLEWARLSRNTITAVWMRATWHVCTCSMTPITQHIEAKRKRFLSMVVSLWEIETAQCELGFYIIILCTTHLSVFWYMHEARDLQLVHHITESVIALLSGHTWSDKSVS